MDQESWNDISDSSTIAAVRYDARRQLLDIRFMSGRIYRYERVPEFVYRALVKSDSKGRYFNAMIRDGFDYDEVE